MESGGVFVLSPSPFTVALCPGFGEFNLFTFEVVIDKQGISTAILLIIF